MANRENQPSGSLDEIGEVDCCPYCKRKIEPPSRKKKCPLCGEYIYVRTRPSDRTRVLVTEDQVNLIEQEWNRYYQDKEYEQLLLDRRYRNEKEKLAVKLGKNPTLSELKLNVNDKLMSEHAKKREWGLYRNCKLDVALTLEKAGDIRGALRTLFEVCYFDMNGSNNVMTVNGKAMPYAESEKIGIKDFDPRLAFFAPAVIEWVKKWTLLANLKEEDARKLFIATNISNATLYKMPIIPDDCWEKLRSKIKTYEKIDSIDMQNQESLMDEINDSLEKGNVDEINKIFYKIRSQFKAKKYEIENKEQVKSLVLKLLSSKNRNLSSHGEALMVILLQRDQMYFESLAKYYVDKIQANFEETHTIGQLAKIDIALIKPLIPKLKETVRTHSEWNTRRFAAFNLGAIAEKNPEEVKDIVPVMIDYIKNPNKVTDRKPMEVEVKGVKISINLDPDSMLGVDQTQWLKDAYIDTLGMFAKGNKELVKPYRALFEKIAKEDRSEYTRKKASNLIQILDS
jgi:hypothetical protein